MPELPDLEVFSGNLDKALSGRTLREISVPNKRKLKVSVHELKQTLEGQKLDHVYREGKELHFKFSKGDVLALHLMLHGQLFLFKDKHEHKSPVIELLFSDGTGLVLTDFQGAATPTLNPPDKDAPDAMAKEMNFTYLKEKLSKKRTNIKTVLLDQHIIRGIGNAYADEILWEAKISPFSSAQKIPDDKIKVLTESVRSVLKEGEKSIRKSNADVISGEVRDFLNIHNAKKKQSPNGASIHIKEIGGRKTYYTDEQELYE